MKPPLLNEEILRRVVRLSRLDGISVLAVASVCAVLSASSHDLVGTAVSLAACVAGAMELGGSGMISSGSERGTRWLVGSQLVLLGAILGYVQFRLAHIDVESIRQFISQDLDKQIQGGAVALDQALLESIRMAYQGYQVGDAGIKELDFVVASLRGLYATVAVGSVLYQGGMIVYYLRKHPGVRAAIEESLQE
jgi:hypothetical protein